jgi:hypothetical protein
MSLLGQTGLSVQRSHVSFRRLRTCASSGLHRCGPIPASRAAKEDLAGREFNERYGARHATFTHGRADYLYRELPKNGDVPRSPLPKKWQPDAVGGHDFNLKIDVGSTGTIGAGFSIQHFGKGPP